LSDQADLLIRNYPKKYLIELANKNIEDIVEESFKISKEFVYPGKF
jgi:hypothetical protein